MKTIRLTEQIPDEDISRLDGKMLDSTMFDRVITEDCDVLTPEGNVLLKFRKNVIPAEMCERTFSIWELAATPTDNRGMAAGAVEIGSDGKIKGMRKEHGKVIPGEPGATRVKFLKKDGTVAKKTVAKTVNSGIVGFVDGNSRFPYCRQTAFTGSEFDKYKECLPLVSVVSNLFKELLPDRWQAQNEYWKRTNEAFRIPDSVFSTVTCNLNFRTACHTDQNDLIQGFGVMCAMRKGRYTGGYTVFPKYKIAVDMQTGDLLLADVHQRHSNSEIFGITGTYKRISLVMYYRERIALCGSPEQERMKAIAKTESTYTRQDALL